MEKYETYDGMPVSVVNIPLNIDLVELEKALNAQLSGVLYEDDHLDDGDNMMLRAVKQGDIKISVDSQMIKYRVPLLLWIRYNAGITTVEGNGEIEAELRTSFELNPDWSLSTNTVLADYEWRQKPRLRWGAMSIPVGTLADLVIRSSKKYLTRRINDLVHSSLDLGKLVGDLWAQMFQPMLVAAEYNTWLLINPRQIGLTPIVVDGHTARATVVVHSQPQVTLGPRPENLAAAPLPPLQLQAASGDHFELHLKTEIAYSEAERIARQELVGETFTSGKRSVTVEDIQVFGSGKNLVVDARLSGSYNGSVYLEGEPVFNEKKNSIELKNLQFTLNTRNFLFRSGAWLLKSTIRKKIQENLNFLLDYNLSDMKEQIQRQLENHQVSKGVSLEGQLESLEVLGVFLTPSSLLLDLGLQGKVKVNIKGLN